MLFWHVDVAQYAKYASKKEKPALCELQAEHQSMTCEHQSRIAKEHNLLIPVS